MYVNVKICIYKTCVRACVCACRYEREEGEREGRGGDHELVEFGIGSNARGNNNVPLANVVFSSDFL